MQHEEDDHHHRLSSSSMTHHTSNLVSDPSAPSFSEEEEEIGFESDSLSATSSTAISTNSFLSVTTLHAAAAAAAASNPSSSVPVGLLNSHPSNGSSSSGHGSSPISSLSPRFSSLQSMTTLSSTPPPPHNFGGNTTSVSSSAPPSFSLLTTTHSSSSSVDRMIKTLSLFLQDVHSSEDLHYWDSNNETNREKLAKISLSTYHMQRLFERIEQYHQQKNREGDSMSKAKHLFQWVLDKIVNTSDSYHVTNSDMDILIQKFRTVVTEIEVFFKKLRNEKEETTRSVVVNLRYFGALNQIIFTGKSTTCQFILSSIINPPKNLRGITFNRNVNIETFDSILDPENTIFSSLRFIDCHELLHKLEDDQCLGEYVLNQVKSVYIEK